MYEAIYGWLVSSVYGECAVIGLSVLFLDGFLINLAVFDE